MGAQIDDSQISYNRIDYYIIFPLNRVVTANALHTAISQEEIKYNYKNLILPTISSTTAIQMFGSFTFLNNADAVTFMNFLHTKNLNGVIYAKIDMTINNHHWADDRVQPDIIIDQIILGDSNAIPPP